MLITLQTHQKSELIDITKEIQQAITASQIRNGFIFIFSVHTTAGITINEHADPDVRSDIKTCLERLIPWKDNYRHLEGNSAAHVKTSLVGSSEWVAIENGKLALGTWQGIFFCEFDGPRTRKILLKLIKV